MYYVDNAHDKVIEGADPGQDTVHSTITYALTANVEYLALDNSGGAINGTGNALNNVITGNDSVNLLNGYDGDDLLHGGLGDDALLGGKGNDTLDGGAGADKMTGGAGADTFVFKSADAASAANADTITDFSAGDAIDIRDVLAGYDGGSLDAFVHLTTNGRNTIMSVDADGGANGDNFVAIATLTGVNVSSLVDADTMAAHGSLIA
jgi:Ca2+-binding RTX toxin-like protein